MFLKLKKALISEEEPLIKLAVVLIELIFAAIGAIVTVVVGSFWFGAFCIFMDILTVIATVDIFKEISHGGL
ncbi:hypothetical protein IJI94_00430 [Candidatus Saccharibacteria bacterium]|nr:hypothetical protein [Candidatus Saccharibacteria bacterium]